VQEHSGTSKSDAVHFQLFNGNLTMSKKIKPKLLPSIQKVCRATKRKIIPVSDSVNFRGHAKVTEDPIKYEQVNALMDRQLNNIKQKIVENQLTVPGVRPASLALIEKFTTVNNMINRDNKVIQESTRDKSKKKKEWYNASEQ